MTGTTPVFRPFDPEGPLRVYVRHLPHWRQPGATYFVTIRQDDSIPAVVLREWLDTRERFYRAHGLDTNWLKTDPDRFAAAFRKIEPGIRTAFERVQARLLHEELDRCHGSCILRRQFPQRELTQSLPFFHGSRLWLGDYTVMPNHVHAIVTPTDDWELEDLLGSIKRWTSRRINQWVRDQSVATQSGPSKHNGKRFWQQESYDRIIRDADELARYRQYIAENAHKANVPPGQFHYRAADWLDKFAKRLWR